MAIHTSKHEHVSPMVPMVERCPARIAARWYRVLLRATPHSSTQQTHPGRHEAVVVDDMASVHAWPSQSLCDSIKPCHGSHADIHKVLGETRGAEHVGAGSQLRESLR